jgi:hypothetical protein
LSIRAVTRLRLAAQQIDRPAFTAAGDLVLWMGAVQAQDPLGSRWAIGLRLRGAVESDIEGAVAARTIVRTWPMRGTLHYVPAADARWMLGLLAPRVIARSAGRYRELGLEAADFRRAEKALARALEGGGSLRRAEAYDVLRRGRVSPEGQRGIHILGHLAQHGVLCLGPRKGKQATFVLLEEWLPSSRAMPRDEALATLAERYFASHGPATRDDFAWWAGLRVKDAEAAIGLAAEKVRGERDEDGRLWFSCPSSPPPSRRRKPSAALLPAWDEYVVAYKDRAALDPPAGSKGRMSTVGLSLLIIDGRVRGAWRRSLTSTTVRVTFDPWTSVTRDEREALETAARDYGRFLGLGVQLV